jgi:cytochrome c
MSTLEINKMVAALLTVGVVAGFSAFLAGVIMHPHQLSEPSYSVAGAVSEDEPAEGAAADAPADGIAAMLASADEAAGKKVAKKCASCHTFDQGGANKVGPNLWNTLEQPIADAEGFGYSDALKGKAGDTWTYDSLDAFIKKPKDFASGTKMTFAGLKKPEDRANLILYMRSMSDSPAPLPEAPAAGAEAEAPAEGAEAEAPAEGAEAEAPAEGAEAEAPADNLAAMLASAEEAAGEKVAKKCAACHTFDQGGANKVGPNLWSVLDRPIASVEDFKYSDALTGMASDAWSYESLDAFLEKPKDFAPGTKMTFAGLKKMEDRANLIVYMRYMSDSPPPLPE